MSNSDRQKANTSKEWIHKPCIYSTFNIQHQQFIVSTVLARYFAFHSKQWQKTHIRNYAIHKTHIYYHSTYASQPSTINHHQNCAQNERWSKNCIQYENSKRKYPQIWNEMWGSEWRKEKKEELKSEHTGNHRFNGNEKWEANFSWKGILLLCWYIFYMYLYVLISMATASAVFIQIHGMCNAYL